MSYLANILCLLLLLLLSHFQYILMDFLFLHFASLPNLPLAIWQKYGVSYNSESCSNDWCEKSLCECEHQPRRTMRSILLSGHHQCSTSGFIIMKWSTLVLVSGAQEVTTRLNTMVRLPSARDCQLSPMKIQKPATWVKFLGSVTCSSMDPQVRYSLLHLDPHPTKKEAQCLTEILETTNDTRGYILFQTNKTLAFLNGV